MVGLWSFSYSIRVLLFFYWPFPCPCVFRLILILICITLEKFRCPILLIYRKSNCLLRSSFYCLGSQ
jgi:hypothetical protein